MSMILKIEIVSWGDRYVVTGVFGGMTKVIEKATYLDAIFEAVAMIKREQVRARGSNGY